MWNSAGDSGRFGGAAADRGSSGGSGNGNVDSEDDDDGTDDDMAISCSQRNTAIDRASG